MISRIVIATMLAASSVSGSAQDAVQPTDGATAYWPHMHQCTLDAVSNFTVTNMGGVATGRSRIAGEITMTRIDLSVTGAPGGSPTITAFAINNKGTGHSSGRMSGAQSPIGVACVASPSTGDAGTQKVSISDFHFMRSNDKSLGWSCSVSGSEEQPVFSVGLLVPTILGQAEAPLDKAASWSWGESNHRVSIVPRGTAPRGSEQFACTSTGARTAGYDLVMMKKA